ncbi:MAG TPA: hypothetical protein VLB02_02065 [Candidatus Paceibacterota bacterium]|nr:hypothetical protein [Candidatus Paceibacterota bacterium]
MMKVFKKKGAALKKERFPLSVKVAITRLRNTVAKKNGKQKK